jgi:hypothetical protein
MTPCRFNPRLRDQAVFRGFSMIPRCKGPRLRRGPAATPISTCFRPKARRLQNNWQKGDVLYTICIAIGAAFLGAAPSFEGKPSLFLLISCGLLIIGALLFRFWPVWRDKRK